MAAIDKDGKLNAARAACGEHSLDGGARRAACVQHIVNENDVFVVYIRADIGLCYDRLIALVREIVAVKPYIHAAAGNGRILDLLYVIADALGYWHSPSADTDQNDVFDALVLFGYLVGYSHKCAAHCRFIHKSCLELHVITPNKRKSPCRQTDKTHKNMTLRAERHTISAILPASLNRLKNLFYAIILAHSQFCNTFFAFRSI